MELEQQLVYLTKQQRIELKVIAAKEGSDVSKLVREAVDALIKQRRLTHLTGELAKFEGGE